MPKPAPSKRRVKTAKSAKSPQWSMADAKARLSEIVEKSVANAQTITRNGKPVAVIVGFEEWTRKTTRKGTLFEFLQSSPLKGAKLDLERLRDEPRELDL